MEESEQHNTPDHLEPEMHHARGTDEMGGRSSTASDNTTLEQQPSLPAACQATQRAHLDDCQATQPLHLGTALEDEQGVGLNDAAPRGSEASTHVKPGKESQMHRSEELLVAGGAELPRTGTVSSEQEVRETLMVQTGVVESLRAAMPDDEDEGASPSMSEVVEVEDSERDSPGAQESEEGRDSTLRVTDQEDHDQHTSSANENEEEEEDDQHTSSANEKYDEEDHGSDSSSSVIDLVEHSLPHPQRVTARMTSAPYPPPSAWRQHRDAAARNTHAATLRSASQPRVMPSGPDALNGAARLSTASHTTRGTHSRAPNQFFGGPTTTGPPRRDTGRADTQPGELLDSTPMSERGPAQTTRYISSSAAFSRWRGEQSDSTTQSERGPAQTTRYISSSTAFSRQQGPGDTQEESLARRSMSVTARDARHASQRGGVGRPATPLLVLSDGSDEEVAARPGAVCAGRVGRK